MLTIYSCEKITGADAIRHMTEDERAAVAARFCAKTEAGPNGCLMWTGGADSGGYGAFHVSQGMARAHRVAHELTHGRPIPADMLLRHRCHNRLCVNPAHLEPGTHADNSRDMVEAGRHATGPGSRPRKLTEEDGVAIKGARILGLPVAEIARMFCIVPGMVVAICSGRRWAAKIEAHMDAVLGTGPAQGGNAALDSDLP